MRLITSMAGQWSSIPSSLRVGVFKELIRCQCRCNVRRRTCRVNKLRSSIDATGPSIPSSASSPCQRHLTAAAAASREYRVVLYTSTPLWQRTKITAVTALRHYTTRKKHTQRVQTSTRPPSWISAQVIGLFHAEITSVGLPNLEAIP